jgi:hypothetical protein
LLKEKRDLEKKLSEAPYPVKAYYNVSNFI